MHHQNRFPGITFESECRSLSTFRVHQIGVRQFILKILFGMSCQTSRQVLERLGYTSVQQMDYTKH